MAQRYTNKKGGQPGITGFPHEQCVRKFILHPESSLHLDFDKESEKLSGTPGYKKEALISDRPEIRISLLIVLIRGLFTLQPTRNTHPASFAFHHFMFHFITLKKYSRHRLRLYHLHVLVVFVQT